MNEPVVGAIVDGRYELRRIVAYGGMAIVFESFHLYLRRTVALKLLLPEHAHNEEHKNRLLREAHALSVVRHPGFVEALDSGICGEYGPYVALEMLEGRTLDGILASRQRLSVANSVQVIRLLCEALSFAHARGIVHRDIKPSNVFVVRTELGHEAIKLIDLGVAAVADNHLSVTDKRLTIARELIGTPEYMAPEQLYGHPVDARADVYALGALLYECLTGEVPYSGTYPEILVKVSHAKEPPQVRAKCPEANEVLGVIVEAALSKDREVRLQSAHEFARALLAGSGLAPAWPSLLTPRASESNRPIELTKVKRRLDEAESEAAQQRRLLRAAYVTPVLMVPENGDPMAGRSEDISPDGMLVLSRGAWTLGEFVRTQFALPGSGKIVVLDARVCWTRDARGKSATGLAFEQMPADVRRQLVEFVSSVNSVRE